MECDFEGCRAGAAQEADVGAGAAIEVQGDGREAYEGAANDAAQVCRPACSQMQHMCGGVHNGAFGHTHMAGHSYINVATVLSLLHMLAHVICITCAHQHAAHTHLACHDARIGHACCVPARAHMECSQGPEEPPPTTRMPMQ